MEMRIVLVLVLLLLSSSCLKKEIPVAFERNESIQTAQVEMASNYKYQVYFNLEENRVVGRNEKTAWDCAYHLSDDGKAYLLLNSAKAMYGAAYANVAFEQLTDTSGFAQLKHKDHESGALEKTALGMLEVGSVYLIDRGVSETGAKLGFRKIEIVEINPTSIQVKFALLDNSQTQVIQLNHDPEYNAVFFHFDGGKILEIEPKKNTWDLVFTQYFITFEEEHIDYLVVGCLQNRFQTQATSVSTGFNALSFDEVQQLSLSYQLNAIGYNWKTFNGSGYLIDTEKNFIVQDQKGLYYNLRFIDFYNEQGEKGCPKFEYVQY